MGNLLAGLAVGYIIGVIWGFVLFRSAGPLPSGRDNRDPVYPHPRCKR